MADSTKDIATQFVPSCLNLPLRDLPLAANGKVYRGTMQTADASGRAKNPAVTTELVQGVVVEGKDNTGGANDAKSCELRVGPHKFAKHATNPPTAADIGKMGYASDNMTISKTSTDGSKAGEITKVESDGVWVDITKPAM